jgi:hypothetical protein
MNADDGVMGGRHPRHQCAKVEVLNTPLEEASMSEVTAIGVDISKTFFTHMAQMRAVERCSAEDQPGEVA